MLTIIPLDSYQKIASVLSTEHLVTQTQSILHILQVHHETIDPALGCDLDGVPFPSVELWREHDVQLAEFGLTCWDELISRPLGVGRAALLDETWGDDLMFHLQAASTGTADMSIPKFMLDERMHISHQHWLLRVSYVNYRHHFPVTPLDLELYWPGISA